MSLVRHINFSKPGGVLEHPLLPAEEQLKICRIIILHLLCQMNNLKRGGSPEIIYMHTALQLSDSCIANK